MAYIPTFKMNTTQLGIEVLKNLTQQVKDAACELNTASHTRPEHMTISMLRNLNAIDNLLYDLRLTIYTISAHTAEQLAADTHLQRKTIYTYGSKGRRRVNELGEEMDLANTTVAAS